MVGLGLMGVWLVGLGRKLSESGFGGWKDLQDGGFAGWWDLQDGGVGVDGCVVGGFGEEVV